MSSDTSYVPRVVITERLRIAPPVPPPSKRYYPQAAVESLEEDVDKECQREVNRLEVKPLLSELARKREPDPYAAVMNRCKNEDDTSFEYSAYAIAVLHGAYGSQCEINFYQVRRIVGMISKLKDYAVSPKNAVAALIMSHQQTGEFSVEMALNNAF